jgi:uncharacterized protein (DUF934 family)
MPTLIRNRTIVPDSWQRLDDATIALAGAHGDVIVPLGRWTSEREVIRARASRTGVLLQGTDDPSTLVADIGTLPLIAVSFASFADGRGYSVARLLRERLGFEGELRAVGHVQRDQLAFLERCGFDAFELRDGENAARALGAFSDFSESYQSAHRPEQPLFRRRLAA